MDKTWPKRCRPKSALSRPSSMEPVQIWRTKMLDLRTLTCLGLAIKVMDSRPRKDRTSSASMLTSSTEERIESSRQSSKQSLREKSSSQAWLSSIWPQSRTTRGTWMLKAPSQLASWVTLRRNQRLPKVAKKVLRRTMTYSYRKARLPLMTIRTCPESGRSSSNLRRAVLCTKPNSALRLKSIRSVLMRSSARQWRNSCCRQIRRYSSYVKKKYMP